MRWTSHVGQLLLYELLLMFVNPTCPKALGSLVAPAGQEAGLVQALAATEPAKLSKHHSWQPPNYHEIAREARTDLQNLRVGGYPGIEESAFRQRGSAAAFGQATAVRLLH